MKLLFAVVGLCSLLFVRGELNLLARSETREYRVLDDRCQGQQLRDVAVLLRRRCEVAELQVIANEVVGARRHAVAAVQIRFYLPSMNTSDFSWATAVYQGGWTIRVHGFKRSQQAAWVQQSSRLLGDADKVIGCWQCDGSRPQRAILMERDDKLILLRYHENKVVECEMESDDVDPLCYLNKKTNLVVYMLNDTLVVLENDQSAELHSVKGEIMWR